MHEEPGEGRLNPMGKGTCTEGGEKGGENKLVSTLLHIKDP